MPCGTPKDRQKGAEEPHAVFDDIAAKAEAETVEEVAAEEELVEEAPGVIEPALVSAESAEEVAETESAVEDTLTPPQISIEPKKAVKKPKLRFAEDILVSAPTKPETKTRKKRKKGTKGKDRAEDGIRLKKQRQEPKISIDEDEEDEY